MFFDRQRPHAFREFRTGPGRADLLVERQLRLGEQRAARAPACEAWAVHVARDRTRVIVVEAWRSVADYRRDPDADHADAALYSWAATGGVEPTPIEDDTAGVIVIDIFSVWRPLVGPVSAFNARNGTAFTREPGCISTTVLRGVTAGRIATYARWRSEGDFVAAFAKVTGRSVASTDDVNTAAARLTLGFIRPDYHSYDLVAVGGERR